MARVERSLLIAALGRQNGRAAQAAQALKLPRKTFYDKLARYGIRPEDYAADPAQPVRKSAQGPKPCGLPHKPCCRCKAAM